jgi:hypothetical protein
MTRATARRGLESASGIVKVISGDPSWRDLTALTYHWWSQQVMLVLVTTLSTGLRRPHGRREFVEGVAQGPQ